MAGYETLIIGLVAILGVHLLGGIYEVHTALVGMLGKNMYRMTHSAVSVIGLVLIVMGFMDRPYEVIWDLPPVTAMAPVILMPFSLMLFAGSGMATKTTQRIVRHPMLWGVTLFAGAHLLANPDKASIMLFGGFLFYGLAGQILGDRKARLTDAESYAELAGRTSLIPFAALLSGRAGASPGGGWKVVGAGLVVYFALMLTHGYFTGVALPVMGG